MTRVNKTPFLLRDPFNTADPLKKRHKLANVYHQRCVTSPTYADFQRISSAFKELKPHILVGYCSSFAGASVVVYGRVPKNTGLLRKVSRGKLVPDICWRTPTGGIYGFRIDDTHSLAAAVRARLSK